MKSGASSRDDEDEELADSRLDADIKELIEKLETGIKLESNPDKELTPVLNVCILRIHWCMLTVAQDFYETLRAKHDNFTNQVKEIVNPCTQAKISLIDSEPTPLDNGLSEVSPSFTFQFV